MFSFNIIPCWLLSPWKIVCEEANEGAFSVNSVFLIIVVRRGLKSCCEVWALSSLQAAEEFVLGTGKRKPRDKSQCATFFSVAPFWRFFPCRLIKNPLKVVFSFLVFSHKISVCLHVQDLGRKEMGFLESSDTVWCFLESVAPSTLFSLPHLGFCARLGECSPQADSVEMWRTWVLPSSEGAHLSWCPNQNPSASLPLHWAPYVMHQSPWVPLLCTWNLSPSGSFLVQDTFALSARTGTRAS